MTKSLTSKLHLKQRLYSHCLEAVTSLDDHLTTFKEIASDLETMEVKYDEEDLGLILLWSLPPSYSSFRGNILYSHDTLSIEEVYASLSSFEKMKHLVIGSESQSEGFVAQGRSQERNTSSKSRGNLSLQIEIKPVTIGRRNAT